MGCEKPQTTPGILSEFAVHGGDQFVLVLMKDGPPLFLGLQVHEVFGVEEAGGVGAVVGTPDLAGALRHFGKRAEHDARLVGDADAFAGAGAGRESAAHPERAFIQMRQEFGTDHAAEGQKDGQAQAQRRQPRR